MLSKIVGHIIPAVLVSESTGTCSRLQWKMLKYVGNSPGQPIFTF